MGYTTEFEGQFNLNKPLDAETFSFLKKLNQTRRMGRKLPKKYGLEGEFFVDGDGPNGQAHEASIIDYNTPPKTQPGLWCQWTPNHDGTAMVWDEGEKFYNYVNWIEYIIENILKPRGYKLTGTVTWQGEDNGDIGAIVIKNNKVTVKEGRIVYGKAKG